MESRSFPEQSGRSNFDHSECYHDNLHDNSKSGRQWCREVGPASRSGRSYVRSGGTAGIDEHHPTRAAEKTPTLVDVENPRRRRDEAAQRYRPNKVRLLLIAEAPPAAHDRYFYFHDVDAHDSLFRYVARYLLPHTAPTRENKPALLAELRDLGVFLIDLKRDAVDGTRLTSYVPELLTRVEDLAPERIILIKATVYDAAYSALALAGLPVSSVRVPFPGSGQQKTFEEAFARALHGDQTSSDSVPLSLPRVQPFAFDLADWFSTTTAGILGLDVGRARR